MTAEAFGYGYYKGPTFVCETDIVDRQIATLRAAFEDYPEFEPLFALKANSHPEVVGHIAAAGLGLHVSSLAEMKLARPLTDSLSYTAPVVGEQELRYAQLNRIPVNANSVEEANWLAGRIGAFGLRINPGVGWAPRPELFAAAPDSQFGARPYELSDLTPDARNGIDRLHMHTSSDSYRADLFAQAAGVVLGVAETLPNVQAVNVGGGFAVPFVERREDFDMRGYASRIINLLRGFEQRTGRQLTLQIEPGSFIVRQAGSYICQIVSKSQRGDATHFMSDGSAHHLRGQPLPLREFTSNTWASDRAPGIVFGRICQRGDEVLGQQMLPRFHEGDFLRIPDVGAYCAEQGDNFNLIGRPEVRVVKRLDWSSWTE